MFSNLIILIFFVLVFTQPTKDFLKSLLLSFCPLVFLSAFIMPPSLYLHLTMDCLFSFLLLLLLLILLLSFSFTSPSSVSPPLLCSFFFFSCCILRIPVGFLRGRTPLADQGQTLLQCFQPLSVSLILSLLFFPSLTDSTTSFTFSYSLFAFLLFFLSHFICLIPCSFFLSLISSL